MIDGQVNDMRADFANWQAEIKEDRADRAAENAEYDAVVAVNLAAYCLDAAEVGSGPRQGSPVAKADQS